MGISESAFKANSFTTSLQWRTQLANILYVVVLEPTMVTTEMSWSCSFRSYIKEMKGQFLMVRRPILLPFEAEHNKLNNATFYFLKGNKNWGFNFLNWEVYWLNLPKKHFVWLVGFCLFVCFLVFGIIYLFIFGLLTKDLCHSQMF